MVRREGARRGGKEVDLETREVAVGASGRQKRGALEEREQGRSSGTESGGGQWRERGAGIVALGSCRHSPKNGQNCSSLDLPGQTEGDQEMPSFCDSPHEKVTFSFCLFCLLVCLKAIYKTKQVPGTIRFFMLLSLVMSHFHFQGTPQAQDFRGSEI